MQKMTSDSTDPEESCVRSNNPGAAAHFTTNVVDSPTPRLNLKYFRGFLCCFTSLARKSLEQSLARKSLGSILSAD